MSKPYPPILDDYLPVEIARPIYQAPDQAKNWYAYTIPFQLSPFETWASFPEATYKTTTGTTKMTSYAAVSIVNAMTNQSVLSKVYCNAGFVIVPVTRISSTEGSFSFHPYRYIAGQTFNINTYYKIQVCLLGATAISKVINTNLTEQLNSEGKPTGKILLPFAQNSFASKIFDTDITDSVTEWSQIGLFRVIKKPTLTRHNATYAGDRIESNHFIFSDVVHFGSQQDKDEKDQVARYSLILKDKNGQVIESAESLIPKSKNSLYHTFKYRLEKNNTYYITVEITTIAGYTTTFQDTSSLKVVVASALPEDKFDRRLSIQPLPRFGYMKLSFFAKNGEKIVISRAKGPLYTYWDDIAKLNLSSHSNGPTLYSYIDDTIESGTCYKYILETYGQTDQGGSERRGLSTTSKVVMCDFEDMFLMNHNNYLKIQYNPDISNIRYVVTESVVNTLGGKYPVIRRNGDMYYRQFNIGGMITVNTEDSDLFRTKEQLLGESASTYDTHNDNYHIDEYHDVILERYYREQVIKFLYDDNVKLFRSGTEGNILVKLTNISLTPEKRLGRRIYSFTAQAVEIDQPTFDNLLLYNITTLKNRPYRIIANSVSHQVGTKITIDEVKVGG